MPELAHRLKWGFGASVVVALLLPFAQGGDWQPMVALGCLLSLWLAVTVAIGVRARLRTGAGWSANFYGMHLAHLGVAVMVIGVTMVSNYQTERNMRMAVGETVTVKEYTFRFDGVTDVTGPNYTGSRGTLEVSENGKPFTTLHPEKRIYVASGMPFHRIGH